MIVKQISNDLEAAIDILCDLFQPSAWLYSAIGAPVDSTASTSVGTLLLWRYQLHHLFLQTKQVLNNWIEQLDFGSSCDVQIEGMDRVRISVKLLA